MSREVKFRGKRLDTSEWEYGYYVSGNHIPNLENYSRGWIMHFGRLQGALKKYEVDPKTVGEYTGLKDKNGVEIYESDLLEYDFYYFEGIGNGATGFAEWRRITEEVHFQDGCFLVGEQIISFLPSAEEDTNYEFESDYEKGLKVVGNIYES